MKLDDIRRLAIKIQRQAAKIEELREEAYGCHGMDSIGGSHAAPVNKLEALGIELVYEESKLDGLIDARHEAVRRAAKAIQGLEDDRQRHILYLRYLATDRQGSCLEWPQIIDIIHKRHKIQARQIYKLHHIAVKNVEIHNI